DASRSDSAHSRMRPDGAGDVARARAEGKSMAMECLWAPWRMDFIRDLTAGAGCFLCDAAAGGDDHKNLVVHRGKSVLCLLNRYPYNNGHLLIAPFRHEGKIESLTSE